MYPLQLQVEITEAGCEVRDCFLDAGRFVLSAAANESDANNKGSWVGRYEEMRQKLFVCVYGYVLQEQH